MLSAAQHCLMMQSFVMSVVFMESFSVTTRAKMMTYLYWSVHTYLKTANPQDATSLWIHAVKYTSFQMENRSVAIAAK